MIVAIRAIGAATTRKRAIPVQMHTNIYPGSFTKKSVMFLGRIMQ